MVDFAIEKRLTQVTIARGNGDAALAVEILEAWTVNDATTSLSWQADASLKPEATRLLVVSSTQHESPRSSIEYSVFQGGSTTTGSHSFAAFDGKRFATVANVSIVGEGFHRRVAIDVDVKDTDACDETTSKLLLRVLLSHEVYADLDELRVMCFAIAVRTSMFIVYLINCNIVSVVPIIFHVYNAENGAIR